LLPTQPAVNEYKAKPVPTLEIPTKMQQKPATPIKNLKTPVKLKRQVTIRGSMVKDSSFYSAKFSTIEHVKDNKP